MNCALLLCLTAAEFSVLLVSLRASALDVPCGCVPGVLVAGGRALARSRSEVEPAASGRCGSVEAVEAVARVQGVLLGKHLPRTSEEFLPPLHLGAICHRHP